MASIDKIYGTQAQYEELRLWLQEHNHALTKYLYPRDYGHYEEGRDRPISMFPTSADVWLWDNCPFIWVKMALADQYNGPPWEKPIKPAYAYGFAVRPINVSRRAWRHRAK